MCQDDQEQSTDGTKSLASTNAGKECQEGELEEALR